MLNFRRCFVSTVKMTRGQVVMHVNAVASSPFADYCVVGATDDNNAGMYLESFVKIPQTSNSRRSTFSHDLAKRCGNQADCAKAMVQCITQRGLHVHTITNPAISHRSGTNDCMLSFRQLCCPSDTNRIFSNTYFV